MKIKICGITCLEDAWFAVEDGVDMLGFNFYPPSPRSISAKACTQILTEINKGKRRVQTIGVFVNEKPEAIYQILEQCGLDMAQLSGDEPPETLEALPGRAFKAIRPRSRKTALEQARLYARPRQIPALLVDAYLPNLYGGTGQTGDWQLGKDLSECYSILLAGGLTAENVAAAIQHVHPWGVDVASGVESRPGRKDPQKVSKFIEAVRSYKMEA
jgi:phosphoribosylanthranilate isomerase